MQDEQSTEKVRSRKMKLAVEAVKKAKYNKLKRKEERHAENVNNNSLCNINFASLQVSLIIFTHWISLLNNLFLK